MDCTFTERWWINLPLRNCRGGIVGFAMVSMEDAHLADMRWSLGNRGYPQARCKVAKRARVLHRFIVTVPPGLYVDHINRNRLDNRRENLRLVTPRENVYNQGPGKGKKYKGITFAKNRWLAQIVVAGKYYYLGRFKVAEDAARAYDRAAREMQGECAYLNFPDETDTRVD